MPRTRVWIGFAFVLVAIVIAIATWSDARARQRLLDDGVAVTGVVVDKQRVATGSLTVDGEDQDDRVLRLHLEAVDDAVPAHRAAWRQALAAQQAAPGQPTASAQPTRERLFVDVALDEYAATDVGARIALLLEGADVRRASDVRAVGPIVTTGVIALLTGFVGIWLLSPIWRKRTRGSHDAVG